MDLVEVVHRDFLAQQLAALRVTDPGSCDGCRDRLGRRMETGIANLFRLLGEADVDERTITLAQACAQTDERFGFVFSVPRAAAIGGALVGDLEEALFGTRSWDTVAMGTLLGALNILLDGLADEVPELFADMRVPVREMLRPSHWRPGARVRQARGSSDHPVAALTIAVLCEWISRVTISRGWRDDIAVQDLFGWAVEAAIDAEYRSLVAQRMTTECVNISQTRCVLRAKSEFPLLVQGLTPLCVHGAPADLDLQRYATCLKAIGRFGGWLDDERDMVEDASRCRWNNALLAIVGQMDGLAEASPMALGRRLTMQLANDSIVHLVIGEGVAILRDMWDSVNAVGLDASQLRQLIADVTASSLEAD